MAQWRLDTQDYDQPTVTRFEVVGIADRYGNIVSEGPNTRATSTSAFGEPVSVPITPVFQLDGLYGLSTRDFEIYNNATGTAVANNSLMTVSTGTAVNGYAVIRSRRAVRYRPGQGAMARFTAMFPGGGATNYIQRAGFFTQEQALQIGYEGDQFGIVRINGGKAEIVEMDFSGTVATGSSATATIRLSGLDFTFTLDPATYTTLGAQLAYLAKQFETNAGSPAFSALLWTVESSSTKLLFLSTSVGDKSDDHSFTWAGTGGLAATTSAVQQGVNNPSVLADYFTPQTSFNIDKLDGTGPSGIILDPSKLNVYQINFRWLGVGNIKFAVEHPDTGDMINFHRIDFSNRNTTPHLDNPSLKIGYVTAALNGASGTDLSVSGASMMGAIEGLVQTTRLPNAASVVASGLSLASGQYHHVLSIKNRLSYQNKINSRELLLKNINAGFVTTGTGATPVTVFLFINYTGLTQNLVYSTPDENETTVFSSPTIVENQNISTSVPFYIFDVTGSTSINVENLRIVLPPNNTISAFVTIGSNSLTRVSLSLSWVED